MKPREILHDTLDIDHGLFETFLTLFTDPKKVVTHSELFTKPWKYATYVVTISCLLTWFFIHLIVDPTEQAAFWNVPRRVLELSNGYAAFYENTQPLKRLLIHAIGLYVVLILLFNKQRKSPSLNAVSLYLIGHSVFLQFIFQSIGIIFLRKGMLSESNVMPFIGGATHITYLLYALIRIYGQSWARGLLIPLVIAIEMVIYGFTSTRLQHIFYYSFLNRDKMHFTLERTMVPGSIETPYVLPVSEMDNFRDKPFIDLPNKDSLKRNSMSDDLHHMIGQVSVFDSLLFVTDYYMPTRDEIAKISVRCFSTPHFLPQWTNTIFEKMNRYSPDTVETFLRIDPPTQTVFTSYRIPNDSNARISIASMDVRSGRLNYNTTLELKGDDIHVYGIAMDHSFVYLCGSARDILNNFELGVILKINKLSGKIQDTKYLGDDSFSSSTKFKGIKVLPGRIEILVNHDYKRLFLFGTSESSVLTLPDRSF